MVGLSPNSIYLKYRCLFNGYLPINETSIGSIEKKGPKKVTEQHVHIVDELYGRFFSIEWLNLFEALYGSSKKMNYYNHGGNLNLPIIGEMRVPYRRIPIYKANCIQDIENSLEEIVKYNPSHKILLRGQNEIFTTKRKAGELQLFYGSENVVEPSFLPSFSRASYKEKDIVSAWHNLADLVVMNLQEENIFFDNIKRTEQFHLFALGLAQHYGLPSVGLDLTDNIYVALWFALNIAKYSPNVPVQATLIPKDQRDANIYVFRCPRPTYFSYKELNINLGNERPIRQSAYFNYCGWGMAKNQLAMNLVAVFNIDSSFEQYLPDNYLSYLFPKVNEDKVLQVLLNIKNKYMGTKFGELLERIYV